MAKELTGKRVAIAGSRKTEEISTLISKQGGAPVVRPLQGTVFLSEKDVEPDLLKFVQDGADWVIFTTGIGTKTLYDLAGKLGVEDQFLNRIRQAKVASRGYKTHSALKELEVKPVAVDEDGTTRGLMKSLEGFDFSGQKVMVQLHGEQAPILMKFLEDRGATVSKILPYQHIAPETEIVAKICDELIGNKLDAVCFTTAVQVRSLFDFARENGFLNEIITSFQRSTLAVAVGKVTAEALREEGVERLIMPENERMGAMVIELARYYQNVENKVEQD
jgi:uroporphyrinogen-III synthase